MHSRRRFIRLGAASIGTLALRPLGLLPALAQPVSSSDYRALVCVFLFGGNDSNNMVIPMDDTSYKNYAAIRGSLALSGSQLTSKMYAATGGAPYAFHAKLPVHLFRAFQQVELVSPSQPNRPVLPVPARRPVQPTQP